jgi:hypothetical protein
MRRQDDELARIASNALVDRPGDGQDAFAVLQATFAQDVDEEVGGAGVGLFDRLVDLPRSHLVPSDPLLTKAHPASIWGSRSTPVHLAPNSSRDPPADGRSSSVSRSPGAGRHQRQSRAGSGEVERSLKSWRAEALALGRCPLHGHRRLSLFVEDPRLGLLGHVPKDAGEVHVTRSGGRLGRPVASKVLTKQCIALLSRKVRSTKSRTIGWSGTMTSSILSWSSCIVAPSRATAFS